MAIAGETGRPENVPQPVLKQMQPPKHVMQVEVHAPLEQPKQEVLLHHMFQKKLWIK